MSAAKETGPFDDTADLPKLARAAQVSLGLDPSTGSGPDSSDGVRCILGAVTTIANGLSELRNRGLGTGHGPATARVGLRSRHAHLAMNAALTWCQLLLDTLADPEAAWRTDQSYAAIKRRCENNQLRSVTKPTPSSRIVTCVVGLRIRSLNDLYCDVAELDSEAAV